MAFKSLGYATGSNAQIKEAGRIIRERHCKRKSLTQAINEMRMLLQSADYLLLAAKGPEDAPEPWSQVRERWRTKAREFM